MGFWKTLWYGNEQRGQIPPKRNPPPLEKFLDICDEIEASRKILSEPVLSIIQTLKDGEWSFVAKGWQGDILYFTHEWFGNILTIYDYGRSSPIKTHCTAEWMTQDEKEAVGSVCWQIYQGRVKWEKEQSLAKQRESFMVLVSPVLVKGTSK